MADLSFITKIADSLSSSLEGSLSHGKKNVWVAAILSFFIPGAGQVYVWEVEKGVKFLLITIALWILGTVLSFVLIGFLFFIAEFLFAIYAAYTAFNDAKAHNESCGE